MQENVRECIKTREICEHFLSLTIPNIRYIKVKWQNEDHLSALVVLHVSNVYHHS